MYVRAEKRKRFNLYQGIESNSVRTCAVCTVTICICCWDIAFQHAWILSESAHIRDESTSTPITYREMRNVYGIFRRTCVSGIRYKREIECRRERECIYVCTCAGTWELAIGIRHRGSIFGHAEHCINRIVRQEFSWIYYLLKLLVLLVCLMLETPASSLLERVAVRTAGTQINYGLME